MRDTFCFKVFPTGATFSLSPTHHILPLKSGLLHTPAKEFGLISPARFFLGLYPTRLERKQEKAGGCFW